MTSSATRRRIEGIRSAAGATTVTERVATGQDDLTTASPMVLITAHAALTHRIHEAKAAPITCGRAGDWEDDLRAQRDLVQAEMLRRMGDD